uniref:Uncharacterized protein n=1 Tax=Arundo donax TaxID=35708 RepID=A0A0A9BP21_ARUDO
MCNVPKTYILHKMDEFMALNCTNGTRSK